MDKTYVCLVPQLSSRPDCDVFVQIDASGDDRGQPPETFLKHVSDSHLDKLYDLPENIQDVMGLQALRPSAAVCKVMTIPNSKCVRIVTPDEHVSNGFHEILVHDMGQEEWPQVTFSDICDF